MFKELNRTHLEHSIYALLIMLPFILLGHPETGAAFGAAFFIGREHAQAEMRVPPSKSFPEFRCFTKWEYWGWDSVLDFLCPIITVCVILIAI